VRRDLRTPKDKDTSGRRLEDRTSRQLNRFTGATMAKLVIKDLAESVELDREAMVAIVGGARIGTRASITMLAAPLSARVVDYPPGFPAARQTIADASGIVDSRIRSSFL
jgi:hypothetical protein